MTATPPIVRLGTVASTQAEAFALAAGGAADGTAIVAEHQTAGRGRRGRTWSDAPGESLLVSVIVRPRLAPARLPLLSYAAAVAVAEALASTTGLDARLKWPNDVLVGGRKIAGILLETRMAADTKGAAGTTVAVGIGINVSPRVFPAELRDRATSVALATSRAVDREALLRALLDDFAAWRATLETQGFEPVRRRWLALADTIGREVTVDGTHGVAVDVDDDGALVLASARGTARVLAGEPVG